MDTKLTNGDVVLIRGRVRDGRLLLDDGTEIRIDAVPIVAEVPDHRPLPYGLVLYFESEWDRHEFSAGFIGAGCAEL